MMYYLFSSSLPAIVHPFVKLRWVGLTGHCFLLLIFLFLAHMYPAWWPEQSLVQGDPWKLLP